MADMIDSDEPDGRGRAWPRWLAVILLLIPLLVLIAVPSGLWFLSETPRGRAFVAEQVSGISPESGLRFEVGRIDGSLLSQFTLVDVVVHDLDGPLALVPRADVEWRPITLFSKLVSLNRIQVPDATLLRMWRLNPGDPEAPLLPEIDISIGRFAIGRLVLEDAVAGRREVLSATGHADIDSGRLVLATNVAAEAGDRLKLLLDAVPDDNRLSIEADLSSPVGGLVATVAGLQQPLTASVDGSGSWERWRGRLDMKLAEARLADIAIQADNGRFRLIGDVDARPFLSGLPAELASPVISLDLTTTRDGDWSELAFVASTEALALSGQGRINTTNNQLDDVRAEMLVKEPKAINPALSGRGMRAGLVADGPLQQLTVQWNISADQLRYAGEDGPMGADGLKADGQVLIAGEDQPIRIPFSATAQRTVGLPAEVAELVARPRIQGTLTYANGVLGAQAVQLTTTQMRAQVNGRMEADGRSSGNFDVRILRFAAPQLGPVAVNASGRFALAPDRGPVVDGRVEARGLGLTNEAAVDFLGTGTPRLTADFALTADGRFAVARGRLASPGFQISDLRATYLLKSGQFNVTAAGNSRQYGPVSLTAAGTPSAPRATLKLARPGLGFDIRDVTAEITPAPEGFRIVATGSSPQGPLDAQVRLAIGSGQPMRIMIDRAHVAGLSIAGQLVQTGAGPFAGRLGVEGPGLDLRLLLAAQGSLQRVDVDLRAVNARIPLATPIFIGAGVGKATILLDEQPHVNARVRLQGVRRDQLVLTNLVAQANLTGATGQAVVDVEGRAGSGEDFALKGRLNSVADGYVADLDGRIGRLPLKLEQPARVVRRDDSWELLPARIRLPKGRLGIAGTWGDEQELRLALEQVDLAIADLILKGAGLSGTASGQAVIRMAPGASFPEGEANIRIAGLSRAGVTGISIPVDVTLAGRMEDGGMSMGARLALKGKELGRIVARVTPGDGDNDIERFMSGNLTGGIRYNGPVEPLWALVGLEDQEVKGPIAIGADFSGTPSDPVFGGIARGQGLVYRNALVGMEIRDIGFEGNFSGPTFQLTRFSGRANGGTISGRGMVTLGSVENRRIEATLDLKNARLANSDMIEATVSGPLRLEGAGTEATLTGDLQVDSARVQIVQVETSEVPQLRVRRAGEVRVAEPEGQLSASSLKLNVRVRADDRVHVDGMGLESVWRADLRVRGSANDPLIVGRANLERGEFSFAGRNFDITTGRIVFNGAPMESLIDIQAQTQADDVTALVRIGGTAARPQISFSSTPSLPEDEILSRLLFGASVADLSVTEAVQLATAVAGLQSGGGDTLGKVRRSVGLDRLRLVGENRETGMGTGLAIGKRLTRNIYLEVLTDSQGNTLTTIQMTLSRVLSLFGEVSSVGRSSANIRYQRDY